ncbi:MAG: NAD-dependent epimerase/dehydratase family protein [Mycobacterium sp.]
MQIAVTGGTGYVGAHTARALLAAGHGIRLQFRADRGHDELLRRLSDLGDLTPVEGDVRDTEAVAELLDGCDALVHAAGVVGTDNRQEKLMWQINAKATESVLRLAHERGFDPIVLVSSYTALFPPPGDTIGPETPTAAGRSAYAKTKAYADRVARAMQSDGAPVVVTYPSSVVGPAFFTAAGISEQGWEVMIRYGVAPRMSNAAMPMIDVRDVADVHVALMRPGLGPRRYVCGGELMTFDDIISAIEEGAGRRLRRIPVSPAVFRAMGRIGDLANRVLPIGSTFSYEAAQLVTAAIPTDDSRTLADLGLTWRSARKAIIETYQQGGGSRRQ